MKKKLNITSCKIILRRFVKVHYRGINLLGLSHKYAKRGHKNFILQNFGYIHFVPFKILSIRCYELLSSSFPLLKELLELYGSWAF